MAVKKGSDNEFPSVLFAEQGSDPATPAAGNQRLFVDSADGLLKLIDDTGTFTPIYGGPPAESAVTFTDITTNNASTSKHGYLRKLDNNAAHYLDGTGAWSTPAGGGGGNVATDAIFDAKGDSPWGTGADTASKLTAGSNGMVPVYDSAQSNGVKTAYPPGYEFDYVAITSNVSPTATSEATANTVVTANAVTYDGSTVIMVEFYADHFKSASGQDIRLWLYDGSSSIGFIGYTESNLYVPVHVKRRITPSAAAHTYSIRASVSGGTGVVAAGAGGNGNVAPAFIRQVRV